MLVSNIVRSGFRPIDVAAHIEVAAADLDDNLYARTEIDGNNVRFTLRVRDSSGPYSRRAVSGRRTVAADFDAHAHVLASMFRTFSTVTVRSALATFHGYGDFLEKWQSVGRTNVGAPIDGYVPFDSL